MFSVSDHEESELVSKQQKTKAKANSILKELNSVVKLNTSYFLNCTGLDLDVKTEDL